MKQVVLVLGVLGMLACAQVASAQAVEAVVSRDIGVFDPGVDPSTGSPRLIINVLGVNAVCGQVKVTAPATVVNPKIVRIDDPADATKDCIIMNGSSLLSLPVNKGYRSAVRALGQSTVTPWSSASNPFDIAPVAPPTPTGIRVLP